MKAWICGTIVGALAGVLLGLGLCDRIHMYSGANSGAVVGVVGIEIQGDPGVFYCIDQC